MPLISLSVRFYQCLSIEDIKFERQCDVISPLIQGWKRHGETCYKIYKDEVPFGTKCNLTITSRCDHQETCTGELLTLDPFAK